MQGTEISRPASLRAILVSLVERAFGDAGPMGTADKFPLLASNGQGGRVRMAACLLMGNLSYSAAVAGSWTAFSL
ncbi:hypothetical protein Stube_67260 [Streptomyces tubercidicus]|uniref:Uncharacterized protein n=1 Tax=Streptomyces tubercidicus TaxID=47759 RepID=A0A640V0Z6_9ACTN|nr:hypothetical protein Stube_67260 [Streptomyces tubercidicus]